MCTSTACQTQPLLLGINYLHKINNLQVTEEWLVHQELKEIREKEDHVD